jgi:uroporphyrinogen-III decarboxylase
MNKGMGNVLWRLAVPPEVETEYAGTRLGEYYSRAEVMLYTQIVARERLLALYGVDIGGPHVSVPAYLGVAELGADLVLPEDDPPMLRNQGKVLQEEAALRALRPVDPRHSRWLGRYLRMQDVISAKLGAPVPCGDGQEGPITSAVLLRGEEFYIDVLERPRLAHQLLQVVTETFVAFRLYVRERNGLGKAGPVGIADDLAGTLPPALWPEFVVPYWDLVYRELGATERSVHTELLRPAHLRFLVELGTDSYDPGNDQFLSLSDVAWLFDRMRVWWNLFTVRDMLNGTPASIGALFQQAVDAGARYVMTELCRGVPAENVRAFVSAGKAHE